MGRQVLVRIAAVAAVAASLALGTVSTASAAGVATAPVPPAAASADANRGGGGGVTPNSKLPEYLQVIEKENKVVATLRGVGTQVYDCAADGSKYVFREPVAALSSLGGDRRVVGIHGKGPVWVSFDGSKVNGTVVQPPTNPPNPPNPAGASNVPWLKLSAVSEPQGGVFSNLTFIQRLDTKGGIAPAGSCAGRPKNIAVDYSANYVFWTKK